MLSVSSLSRKGFSQLSGLRALPKADAFDLIAKTVRSHGRVKTLSGNNTRSSDWRLRKTQFL
jgi:hypothetical protein